MKFSTAFFWVFRWSSANCPVEPKTNMTSSRFFESPGICKSYKEEWLCNIVEVLLNKVNVSDEVNGGHWRIMEDKGG